MRRGMLPAAAAIAVAVFGAGAITFAFAPRGGDGERLVLGYGSPGQEIALGNLTIEGGRYRVGYEADIQFFSSDPLGRMSCGLVDTTGRIDYLGNTLSWFDGDGTWRHISATARINVPDISIGLRCSPSTTATIGVAVRDVLINAVPLGD